MWLALSSLTEYFISYLTDTGTVQDTVDIPRGQPRPNSLANYLLITSLLYSRMCLKSELFLAERLICIWLNLIINRLL